ncbi:hypothetical protein ASF27_01740 [Methylobacterium sp. Leaf102]|uniref:baseplate multidomain protein megatron n=1 Tax=Methylobacterium sp. Leaf102 TaxID=1736253 RepID=UPI0006FA82BB|nr:glycoside hydrolase/phage tail family protein [Methylobacterium sp. Leaf102]KQP34309.1 hypothetical protein ASF27_01740 [Methylobacterium sp. Leaf102]
MSTLVLTYAGQAIGTAIGGPIGGMIGGTIGAAAGSAADRSLFGSRPKPQINTGPRLSDLYVTASTEGAAVARVFGRVRVSGQIVWATKLKEEQDVERVKTSGGKGAPSQKAFNVTYRYSVSFAVALCEGVLTSVGTVYADGKAIKLSDYNVRVYLGTEIQNPDPKIEAVEGAGNAPAYRGVAYLVFEDLPLAGFGNRVPVITAEVTRRPPSVSDRPSLEDIATAVTMIPSMGEFVYATNAIMATSLGAVNGQNTISGGVDILKALDQLATDAPNCRHVSLVVAWQGTDVRLEECRIVPKVETQSKETNVPWQAGGVVRADAEVVSLDEDGIPLLGGAPSDLSVVEAIQALKARGYVVTLYPFVMMDIPEGNGLPDPYGGAEQAAFPWRGRITCTPAPGRLGSPDKTGAITAAVAKFFGTASAGDLSWNGATVRCAKAEFSFRRFILHVATLGQAAGGVDSFVMGSEMIGLTSVRSDASTYPAVGHLKRLAAEARAILGPATAIGYGADWTEFANHRPADGSNDVFFRLDPLWADPNIDFIGIDNYMPIADWRDGYDHLDARAGVRSVYDFDYLTGNIAGGELFDWFYPTQDDRDTQNRVAVQDTAHGEHWVFRIKDLRGWWANAHHDRPGGVRQANATAWVPQSKPIRFTEIGCPCVDKGANQPNVFVDPKSSESFLPYYSNGRQDLAMQRAYLEATLSYWQGITGNPVSAVYGGRMVDQSRIYIWTWDARPFPEFPRQTAVWTDGLNYHLGHWINGRLGLAQLPNVVADLCNGAGAPVDVGQLHGVVQGYTVAEVQSPRASIEPLRAAYFFDGAESAGRIAFRPLAGAPVAGFTESDLVAAGSGADYNRTRTEETALPGVIALTFIDPSRTYQTGSVEARRMNGRAAAVARMALPLCLDEGAARGITQATLYQAVVEREAFTATLPPSALALDALDIVTVSLGGVSTDYRLTRLGLELGRPASGVRSDSGVFAYRDGTATRREPAPPATIGVGLFRVMDLPQLRPQAIPHAPYLAGFTSPWSPIAVLRSIDGGPFENDATVGARSIIGRLVAPLHSGPSGRWDRVNDVFVEVPRGTELPSAPEADVLNGANVAALLTPSGEWEVLQWASAALLGPGKYRLRNLLRGQLGTEFTMGNPAPAGADFVVLSDALAQSSMPLASRTLPQTFKWGPLGQPTESPAYSAATLTFQGVGLRPYAPAQARIARAGNGDLALSWARRTRINGDAWEQIDVPLNEEVEAYSLDIRKGSGVVRTLELDGPATVYAVADQTADFGGPVTALSVAIHQLSTIYGRGPALEATLYV